MNEDHPEPASFQPPRSPIDWDRAPKFGRRRTILNALGRLHLRADAPRIVETGSARAPNGCDGDGWSTAAFGWYAAATNGRFWTIDIDPRATALARSLAEPWRDAVEFVTQDSVAALRAWDVARNGQINFLYLDSLDYFNEEESEQHSLAEIQAAFDHLAPNALVLLDDVWFIGPPLADGTFRIRGKGALSIPWLQSNGFRLEWCTERQALLARGEDRFVPTPKIYAVHGADLDGAVPETSRPLRILWSSNAPWIPSGYGVQTKLFAPRLRDLGHEVAIHCFCGLDGGSISWEGLPLYPRGHHPHGQDAISVHAEHFKADVVIFHCDAWVLEPELLADETRIIPWFPVDCDPIPPRVADRLHRSWRSIAFSRFGQRKAQEAGIDAAYIPLGVDTAAFRPMDRAASRKLFEIPDGAFVVGMVAMNKEVPSRKAFPQALEAFAEFHRSHRDAILYLHTQPKGIAGRHGVDLVGLAAALGIERCVQFAPEYIDLMGLKDEQMAMLYSAFDVLLAPSLGEGFCVPVVEAQACGRPVIVSGWTSTPEACFAGIQIPRTEAEPTHTALGSWQLIPKVGAIATALDEIHNSFGRSGLDPETARAGAMQFDVGRIAREMWQPFLQSAARDLQVATRRSPSEKKSQVGCDVPAKVGS